VTARVRTLAMCLTVVERLRFRGASAATCRRDVPPRRRARLGPGRIEPDPLRAPPRQERGDTDLTLP